jgi:MFS family permease
MARVATALRSRSGVFYGWWVVAGTCAILFVGFGAVYAFGAFFRSLRDEFGATRQEISLVFALTGFLYFAVGAFSGRLADRIGPRVVIAAGGVLLGAGLLLAAVTQRLWQIYATYSLCVGLGVGLSYVPAVGAVQRWFIRQRGLASGLAVTGIALGNLLLPPIAATLIAAVGWRWAYVLIGVTAFAVMLAAAALMERAPEACGLTPDGDPRSPENSIAAVWGATPSEALRSREFWLLYLAMVATSLGLFIPFVHLVPYATDLGISDFAAAFILGAIGAGSAAGRLVLGGTADRLGRRQALIGSFALMAATQLWWWAAMSTWSLLGFAFCFGVGYGGFVALIPALTSDYFGVRQAGAIIGLLYTGASIGTLLGPTLAGLAFDLQHSYTLPILLSAGANVIAVSCMVVLGDTPAQRWSPSSFGAPR